MSSAERNVQGRVETKEQADSVNIERVFPYFIPAYDYVIRELEAGREPALLKVVMGIKSDESEPSPAHMTPISGRRNGEEPLVAAHRIIREKTTLAASPVQGYEEDYVFTSEESFSYRIDHPNYPEDRQVLATAVPVLSTAIVSHSERGKGKFKKVINLPVYGLRSILMSGFYERVEGGKLVKYPLIESAKIDDADSPKDRQLSAVLSFLSTKEEEIKHMIIDHLGGHRRNGSEKLLSVYRRLVEKRVRDLTAGLGDDPESIRQKAKEDVASLVKGAVDVVTADLDTLAFVNQEQELMAQIPPESKSSKTLRRLRAHAERLRVLINKGNKGTDILHLLPLIAKLGPHVASSTAAATTFTHFVEDLFKYAPERLKMDPYALSSSLESLDSLVDHSEIVRDLQRTNREMFVIIDELFGFERGFAKRIWRESLRYIPKMADSIKEVDPASYEGYFQIHERRRNIRNLPYLIHEGLHGKTDVERFEALRQLFIYFKGLFVRKRGEDILDAGDNHFRIAIDTFFKGVDKERGHGRRALRLATVGNYLVAIDEKSEKDESSQVRKALLENPDDIKDIFSQSIVLIGDSKERAFFDEGRAIRVTQNIANRFISHLRRKNPGYEVSIVDDRSTFDFYRAFYDNRVSKKELEELGGKRVGSKSELMVRRKFVAVMKNPQNPQEEYVHEFTFYPFISIGPFTVGHKLFMGWAEKLEDDKPYIVRRMVEPLPGMHRSMYDLLFPSVFYDHAPDIQEKLREQVLADLIPKQTSNDEEGLLDL